MPWFFIMVFIMGSVVSFSEASTQKLLRVRLHPGLTELSLDGKAFAWAEDEAPGIRPVSALSRPQRLRVSRVSTARGWLWKVEGLRSDGLTILRSGDRIGFRAGEARFRGESLPTRFLLSAREQTFDLIGVVDLEEYLVGVLAGEVPVRWPLETLKAQAVVARSYALAVSRERARGSFHLESTIQDQVFRSLDEIPAADRERLQRAVEETRGDVLVSPDGRVLKAFYHSDCGGRTASAPSVWGGGFDSGTAVDPLCPATKSSRWSLRVARKSFETVLRKLLPGVDVFDLGTLRLQRGEDHRVRGLMLAGEDGASREIPATELRRELGFTKMKSTRFEIRTEGDEILIAGQGFGHGVGLCQWGSRAMGARGENFERILAHYYPKAALQER